MDPDSINSRVTSLGELLRQEIYTKPDMYMSEAFDKYMTARMDLNTCGEVFVRSDLSKLESRFPKRVIRLQDSLHAKAFGLAHDFNKTKEKTMNYDALVQLADNDFAKEVQKYTGNSIGIKAALDRKLAKRKEEAEEAAADVILQLMDKKDQQIENKVARIREYRRMIKCLQAELDTLTKATEYGNATNNFLPLMRATGMSYRLNTIADEKLFQVPADFKSSVETEAEAKAA